MPAELLERVGSLHRKQLADIRALLNVGEQPQDAVMASLKVILTSTHPAYPTHPTHPTHPPTHLPTRHPLNQPTKVQPKYYVTTIHPP